MINLKKFNCLILSVLLIFISAFIASQPISASIIKIGVITGSDVRLRSDATTSSDIVYKFDKGTTVTVIGSKPEVDTAKYTWYQVSYTAGGQNYIGFVREDLISVSDYNTDPTFEQQLAEFPADYHEALRLLHAIYPNWTFRADKLTYTFSEAVALEDYTDRKLIDGSYKSLRSMRKGCYDWNTNQWIPLSGGNWYGASTELIAYYMDPRNFLNTKDIYYFLQQGLDTNTQNLQGVQAIIVNTFLNSLVTDANDPYYNRSYAEVIWDAGIQSSVNPYFLASTIIQEQGINGATLGKGYNYNGVIVYNFFNWKANGTTGEEVNYTGGKYAYENGWTTPSASIIGGAKMYGDKYVKKGQDTYFYKNFNIITPDPSQIWHQYAQNVADGRSSAVKLSNNYINDKTTPLTFRIPVYKNNSLPTAVSQYPVTDKELLNNYYFNTIQAGGLTPAFERYTYEYSLSVLGDTSVYIELPSGATLTSADKFNLNQGDNAVVLTVKSQTGYTKNYVIYVNAAVPCSLTVTGDKGSMVVPNVLKGDTNSDGKVSLGDLANIRLHLLNIKHLSGNNLLGADTNGDGKVSLSDLAGIRLHLLGIKHLG